MEKSKNGFLLGKFHGFHIGHIYLIESALHSCEHLTVLVCTIHKEEIDGVYRYQAIREYFKDYINVKVLHYNQYLPQEPSEDIFFWEKWIPIINQHCPNIDIVFSSEDYGQKIAEKLGANVKFEVIDKLREAVNISGTEVRNNPIKNYDYIAPTMRWYFNKKIAIVGAESVGKTTLTKKLAEYYRTTCALEYGRIVAEKKPQLEESDFIEIGEEQNKLIHECNKKAYRVLFSDTEALTTKVFLPKYCKQYSKLTEKYLEQYIVNQKFSIYFVLAPDTEPIQDGTRLFLEQRETHHQEIINELKKYNKPFVVLHGTYEQKFLQAINLCNKILI